MRARGRKTIRSMRLPEADSALIDRAVGLCGRSRRGFARAAAVRAAEQVVIERTPIATSPERLHPLRGCE